MIYTSYYAMIKKFPSNVIPISIAGIAPKGYKGLQYKKLAPKYSFFSKWKENHDNEYYIKNYNELVLKDLDPASVVADLYSMLPDPAKTFLKNESGDAPWTNDDCHIALVCYEKSGDFCHRHLVADWLNQAGYDVKELEI